MGHTRSSLLDGPQQTFRTALPGREPAVDAWPRWLGDDVVEHFVTDTGIARPYRFQAQALAELEASRAVVVSAGTGAGKSAIYQLAAASVLARSPRSTVLYLAPTRALARDQARRLAEVVDPSLVAVLDSDTPPDLRRQAARRARVVLTNPDMLSASLLPDHARWARILASVALVVIDESHVYRGVFGSHVAHVLRRLWRVAPGDTAAPRVLATSATIANPAEHLTRLTGIPAAHVSGVGAPDPGADVVLWNPYREDVEVADDQGGSALGDASLLLAELVAGGTRTIAFTRSRRACELVTQWAQRVLRSEGRDDLAGRIAPYRGGYTAAERRRIEQDLVSGELLGVVATSALELGIDVGDLGASICIGFPGTIASLSQRWGRAGRTSRGLRVLIAGDDGIDQYLVEHPAELMGRPMEAATVDPDNPYVLRQHLCAAASELPLTAEELPQIAASATEAAAALEAEGTLQAAPSGLVYAGGDHPARAMSLRSIHGQRVQIVDAEDGSVVGDVDPWRAQRQLHAGAVYLHRLRPYVVDVLDLDRGVALATPREVPWYTLSTTDTDVEVLEELRGGSAGGVACSWGRIRVTEQVTGFVRRSSAPGAGHSLLDAEPLDLPPVSYETEACWLEVTEEAAGLVAADALPGTLHAAEHAMIAMLPLMAMCDRWDIGGISTIFHEHAGGPMIVIYDGHPGGVGLAGAGHAQLPQWLRRTWELVRDCPCSSGCPGCVQSPKCGNLNEPLDKAGAIALLGLLSGES